MRGYSQTLRILMDLSAFALVASAIAVVLSGWFLASEIGFLGLFGAVGAFVLSVGVAVLALVSLLSARLRSAVGNRPALIGLSMPVVTVAVLLAALALGGSLSALNFKVYQDDREAAARWALSEHESGSFSPYGEPLPAEWERLSDSGEVIVVDSGSSRGVIFFEVRGILEGTGWLYTDDPDLAARELGDPVQLDTNWWTGDL